MHEACDGVDWVVWGPWEKEAGEGVATKARPGQGGDEDKALTEEDST